MDDLKRFRVTPGNRVELEKIDPGFTGGRLSKEQAEEELEHHRVRLRELQEMLWVEGRRSLLVCLQAMDTGGKDGTIKHVLAAMNPQGCRVVGFRQPSAEEAAHDFLWRVHRAAPARGEVAVFNRSHYEDVLVVRVHQLVPPDVWSRRYDQINAFETGLHEHATHVLKFFLHISREEQLERLRKRLDDPTKHWKVNESDYRERVHWDAYMAAYQEALSRCSTEHAPWFVIPSDRKWFRNLVVARILVEHMERLHMTYPAASVDLEKIRREYHEAKA